MGFDLGKTISDAANTAGQIITHPADDVSSAWDVAIHPADDFNTIVKVGPDYLMARVNDFGHMTGDVADFMGSNFKKFAQSDLGKFVLTKLAGSEYMAFVPMIGPAALLIFAIPGLLQGQDFGPAWLDGTVRVAQDALKGVSGGNVKLDLLPPDVQQRLADVSSQYFSQIGTANQFLSQPGVQDALKASGLPDLTKVTPEQIAQHLGLREDAVWAALDNLRKDAAFHRQFLSSKFDPVTGKRRSARELAATNQFRPSVSHVRQMMGITNTSAATSEALTLGSALVSKSALLTHGSLLGGPDSVSKAAYKRGFEIAIGATAKPISASALKAIRDNIQPNEKKGFDAGIATKKGMRVTFVKMGGGHPSALAGAALTRGLIGAPPEMKTQLLTSAAANPLARDGALAAGRQIMAARADAHKSLWQKFLSFFGL
jgi:hypothetical protein